MAIIVAAAQDWSRARGCGGDGSNQHAEQTGNVTGLLTVADRQAQSGASDKTQRMADKAYFPQVAERICAQFPGRWVFKVDPAEEGASLKELARVAS